MAVGGDEQSVESVGDEIVERVDCAVELGDSGVEGAKHSVEVIVEGEQCAEAVLDCLEEVEPAVPESDERGTVVKCLVVGGRIILSDLHVPHGEVTEGPAGAGSADQFLVEGHAGDLRSVEVSAG